LAASASCAFSAMGAFGGVRSAVVLHPPGIPTALAIWDGIAVGGFLADPEGGGDDCGAPGVLSDGAGGFGMGARCGAERPDVLLEGNSLGAGLFFLAGSAALAVEWDAVRLAAEYIATPLQRISDFRFRCLPRR